MFPEATRNRGRRGVTLVEMAVATGVAMVILACAYLLYHQNRLLLEKPRASFNVQDDLMAATRWIERDLSETNLLTVRTYPNPTRKDEPPGLSLESPRRTFDEALVMSEFGGVRWQKYVYYTVEPVDAMTGNLVRYESPDLTDQPSPIDVGRRIPVASSKTPSEAATPTTRHVLARNVLLAGAQFPSGAPVFPTPGFVAGLRVNGVVTSVCSNVLLQGPVEVDLRVYTVLPATGRASAISTTIIVEPRN